VKALQIDRFGPIDALEVRDVAEAPLPPDSVRVEIEAAGVNPSDAGIALGRFPQVTLPRVLGRDFAGRIVEGPDQLIGTPVWGSGGGELGLTRDGSHAQRLVLPAAAAIRRPERLTAQQAAVAGVPFVTAWSALVELGGLQSGEWVIVSGAAGAVGSAAVALARALDAHPIALVRERDDLPPLLELGAAAVLPLDRDDVPAAVRELTGGKGAALALNGVGAPVFRPLLESLGHGGRMVVYSALAGREVELDLFKLYRGSVRLLGLDTAVFPLLEAARIFAKLAPLFDSGAVTPPPIAATFPLSAAREAYLRVNAEEPGKVVLAMAGA
jgi:NADPH:quinone reductase-like Zn-dependent oxidoreductase